MDYSVELRAVSDVNMGAASSVSTDEKTGDRRLWGWGVVERLVVFFPGGLESLNGKFNRALRRNHKSQEGGKTV